ncbi:Tn7 transposase TnsA N-terminal domain-containing protein [Pseudomonas aeruginosa]|uniref:Tn7 transposase TnsA N-terminal domain-containing protein n=1 Tax=Pseudomonas aeruginosa TaxID=287 RepID=UPI002A69FACF|nr:Tn7 transposase TnsA N-terminal domain-containing protein [Pseudomonas aeruginosa]MDY1338840.1 Tn7 transposase TnsA N-terminal domain-containing protein [Pseudomonas aeruginosa]
MSIQNDLHTALQALQSRLRSRSAADDFASYYKANATLLKNPNSANLMLQISESLQSEPDIAGKIRGKRCIHQGNKHQRTALFPSKKANGTIQLESQLELAYAIELERNSQVLTYRAQPLKIPLPGNRFAFPDFLLVFLNGSIEIHEVKPSKSALTPDQIEKFEIIHSTLSNLGIEFKIVDSSELQHLADLDKLLMHYARGNSRTWNYLQLELAIKLIGEKNATPKDAYDALTKNNLPPQIFDYLWFHKILGAH